MDQLVFLLRWVKLDMRTGANISVATFDETGSQVLVWPRTLEVEGDRDDVVFELEKLDVDYECGSNYGRSKTRREVYLGCYHHEWNHVYPNITWIGDSNSPERYVWDDRHCRS